MPSIASVCPLTTTFAYFFVFLSISPDVYFLDILHPQLSQEIHTTPHAGLLPHKDALENLPEFPSRRYIPILMHPHPRFRGAVLCLQAYETRRMLNRAAVQPLGATLTHISASDQRGTLRLGDPCICFVIRCSRRACRHAPRMYLRRTAPI